MRKEGRKGRKERKEGLNEYEHYTVDDSAVATTAVSL